MTLTTEPHGRAHGARPPARPVPVTRALQRMAGMGILVLNWRDVEHPQAGGAEAYVHETARRWVAAGARVTMLTARAEGQSRRAELDGIDVRRAGGTLGVYVRTALRLLRSGHRFDVVLDAQNGIPFFAPLFLRHDVPVVQLVHHVHQDQFATRFGPLGSAFGKVLEGPVSRGVYATHRYVAVSPSTRQEMRRRLRVEGIIDVIPNGCDEIPDAAERQRAEHPTVVLTSRLVPHKRVEVLLHAAVAVRSRVPDLRVEIIGGGVELERLRETARTLGVEDIVTLHGRLPDAERDAIMRTAWVTTSTSLGEGWGCVVLEAAALGVPCVALRAPGVRDSVVDGVTGRLVDPGDDPVAALSGALTGILTDLALPAVADSYAEECRRWAACFSWDRTADLLAAALIVRCRADTDDATLYGGRNRRTRSDSTTLVHAVLPDPQAVLNRLRLTDEIAVADDHVTAILRGSDDVDALELFDRLGATGVHVRPANRYELLGGPGATGLVAGDRADRAAADTPADLTHAAPVPAPRAARHTARTAARTSARMSAQGATP